MLKHSLNEFIGWCSKIFKKQAFKITRQVYHYVKSSYHDIIFRSTQNAYNRHIRLVTTLTGKNCIRLILNHFSNI